MQRTGTSCHRLPDPLGGHRGPRGIRGRGEEEDEEHGGRAGPEEEDDHRGRRDAVLGARHACLSRELGRGNRGEEPGTYVVVILARISMYQ